MTDVKPNVELRPNSEEREKQQQDKQNQSTVEWAKEKANEQYEAWLPWIEDTFLKYFTKDNKASYVAKGTSLSHDSYMFYTRDVSSTLLFSLHLLDSQQSHVIHSLLTFK
jgi:hypothetical protein